MAPFVRPDSDASLHRASIALPPFVSALLVSCLDIRSLWSLDHCPGGTALQPARLQLLAFADPTTLGHLGKCERLHHTDVELLVVVDGDRFESAWGPSCLSGSLARWAWRQVSAHEAYYDEARWAERDGDAGNVVRIRRKALLLWHKPLNLAPWL